MLWRVLQSNGGLPAYSVVCFANTGKEDEATLRFVKRVSDEWSVPIGWLEYRNDKEGFALVDFETASRQGEPFEAIIKKRGFLPNPVARFCTVVLKIETEIKYLKSLGWAEWQNMVGIRADEPRRAAKIRQNPSGGKSGPDRIMPLADAGITKRDVFDFWNCSSFDLELPNMNGVTMHGNCDLCYLKGAWQIQTLINEKPERAIWWAKMESMPLASKPNGGTFRSDRASYAQMLQYSKDQQNLFNTDEDSIPCFCGE
jgi:3'-phosphoadenosine 5'-phosphosulfate sulfotransferase (PAPS reductase)/FAD synthetase